MIDTLHRVFTRQREKELFLNPYKQEQAQRQFWQWMFLLSNAGWITLSVTVLVQVMGASK
jgi:hypothetical protein